jgi:predicted SAM-dependent methyltransferase
MDNEKIVLNVGSGNVSVKTQSSLFNDWKELKVDLDDSTNPDIISDIRNLKEIDDNSIDAIWACHVVEHLCWQELPDVFNSFVRVLKNDGFCIIRVPDLGAIADLIKEKLLEPVYTTQSGLGVAPIDMIYGHRIFSSSEDGNDFMLHKTGFTQQSMSEILNSLNIKCFITTAMHEVQCVIYKDKVPDFIIERKSIL